MWDPMFEQCLKAFKVEEASMRPGSILLQNLPPVRALHFNGDGRILLGTGNDEVQLTVCIINTRKSKNILSSCFQICVGLLS